jgi:allophanate hydrolase subunit 1
VPRAAASPVAAVSAATTGTTAVPAQQTPVQSAPTTAPQTATPAATAVPVVHDSAAATNAQVLEELRSIRNEIEARKKHVDSLTHALDSLKKTDPSR